MILTVTDPALDMVLQARAQQDEPESLALFVEVAGVAGGEYAYDVSFLRRDEIDETDTVELHGDVTVVMPRGSAAVLAGATVDVAPQFGGGLAIDNPNRPTPSLQTRPPEELTGTVDERIRQVLDEDLNPAIAQHGGRAELVRVEGDTAYLRLGGGCQGCGMAAVTLREGIETAIRSSVPEIDRIVDVTDHASGANPYYQPA
jgi:Fe/S biogenesis protein NfuA